MQQSTTSPTHQVASSVDVPHLSTLGLICYGLLLILDGQEGLKNRAHHHRLLTVHIFVILIQLKTEKMQKKSVCFPPLCKIFWYKHIYFSAFCYNLTNSSLQEDSCQLTGSLCFSGICKSINIDWQLHIDTTTSNILLVYTLPLQWQGISPNNC